MPLRPTVNKCDCVSVQKTLKKKEREKERKRTATNQEIEKLAKYGSENCIHRAAAVRTGGIAVHDDTQQAQQRRVRRRAAASARYGA